MLSAFAVTTKDDCSGTFHFTLKAWAHAVHFNYGKKVIKKALSSLFLSSFQGVIELLYVLTVYRNC